MTRAFFVNNEIYMAFLMNFIVNKECSRHN